MDFAQSGPTLQYFGPELAQLIVTTQRAQPGDLYANALRLYASPDSLTKIDGQSAQVIASEWGITLLAVETDTGDIIAIRQNDPRTRSSDFRYALNDDTIRSIASQLMATSQGDWAALAETIPQDPSDFVADRPPYLPTISRVLAGPGPAPLVQTGEQDVNVPLRIILYENSIDPIVFVGAGDQATTSQLLIGDGISAPEQIEMDLNGTVSVSALVVAGPDVDRVDLTNGSTTVPLPMTESFPDVFPAQRFAYVITGTGYWLEVTLTDGTIQRDDLASPGQ